MTAIEILKRRAWAPVDQASLAAFRVLFGLLMAAAMIRFAAKGWIRELYLDPAHHFSYWGLDWIRPPGAMGTYALFAGIFASALGLAFAKRARLWAAVFFLLFTWVELIDKTTYLNHYYFISIVGLWLCLLPTGDGLVPLRTRAAAPAWAVWCVRSQVGMVWFYAGLAKIDSDWLLRAQPLRLWLSARSDLPVIGPFLGTPLAAYGASWAGLLFDLAIPFMLLARRTRPFAFAAVVVFHAATWLLFPIGMFPWIMIAAATIFFAPDWARRGHASVIPPAPAPSRPILLAAGLLLCVQIAAPLRSLFQPGDSRWTERGYRFAWRVMLVEKLGSVEFTVEYADGTRTRVDPPASLTPLQNRMMAYAPDMIAQCAGWIAVEQRSRGRDPVAVYVDARVTLNGRPSRALLDPHANLLRPRADWILNHE